MKRAVISSLAIIFALSSSARALMPLQYLMVHWQDGNMLSSTATDAGVAIIDTAATNGYNGFVWEDWHWEWYFNQSPTDKATWLTNAQRIRNECVAKKMVYLPAMAAMGATASLLANVNRNLAEGFPVKDAPMVVQGGQLVAAPTDPNGAGLSTPFVCTFDTAVGNVPDGWTYIDGWGTKSSLDAPGHGGAGSCLKWCNLAGGNGRMYKTISVQPYRAYHASVWIKTSNFTSAGATQIQVLAVSTGQGLQQATLMSNGDTRNGTAVQVTQDWTQYDVVFNTLSYTQVNFYIGTWGGAGNASNIMWLDDVTIAPLGFCGVIRKSDSPPRVTSPDGKTVYMEGRDYSQIGRDDTDTAPGTASDLELIYQPPQTVTVPTASPDCKLHEGDQVLVSYNHMQEIGGWGQICGCMSEMALYDAIGNELQNVQADLNPPGYFMAHDEMREGGWDDTCTRSGKTPGQILADNVRRCQAMVRKQIPPSSPGNGFRFPIMLVWSDMFDKYHNAALTGNYYLVKGTGPWQNSWKGLTPELLILNWNSASANSQKWFSGNSNVGTDKALQPVPCKQILSCSGDSVTSVDGPLATAATIKNLDGSNSVIGVCYTTWSGNYSNLAAFSTEVQRYCTLPPTLP